MAWREILYPSGDRILIGRVLYVHSYAKNRVRSYQSLVGLVYGPGVELFMIVSIAIFGFGACVTFLVIIGDQFTPVMEVLTYVFPEDCPLLESHNSYPKPPAIPTLGTRTVGC